MGGDFQHYIGVFEEDTFRCINHVPIESAIHDMRNELIFFILESEEDDIIYLKHLDSDVRLLVNRKCDKISWDFEKSEKHQMNLKYPLSVDVSSLIKYDELSDYEKKAKVANYIEWIDTEALNALKKIAEEEYRNTLQKALERGNDWKRESLIKKREDQAKVAGLDGHVKKKVRSRF